LWVHLLCKWNYAKGWFAGKQEEAYGWADALDRVMVPNWQNLVDPSLDREQQEAAAKMYVAAFRDAKLAIALTAAQARMACYPEEFGKMGFRRKGVVE
jgi:hypothetical protein